MRHYIGKMRGGCSICPPRPDLRDIWWSWVGAFGGISAVGLIHYKLLAGMDLVMIIGSFGASAVLIYGAIKSPLAQPRNLIGGHVISALVGVLTFKLIGHELWFAAAVAVASAIAIMHMTRTLHPPGGATALIAVLGGESIQKLGFMYAIVPAGLGASVMLIIALIVNNLTPTRRYPEYWF